MSQSSKLEKDKITFTTTTATTGELSYDNADNKFNFDRAISANGGIVTTAMTVSANSSINFQGYGDINVKSLAIEDDSTGKITLDAPASVTNYTVKMPSAQGAVDSTLVNDGSGNLSWTVPTAVSANSSSGYFDIGDVRVQYGTVSLATDNPVVVTLPASYANSSYSVNVSVDTTGSGWTGSNSIGVPIKIQGRTTTTFTIDRDNDMDGTAIVHWQTMGTK